VPQRDSSGWWGAVPVGGKPDARVNWTKKNQALLLPPGAYDVYWVQDYETSGVPLLLAAGVKVASGAATEVKADSGLKLKLAAAEPALEKDGIWGASLAGSGPDKLVNWWKGTAEKPLLLPAGSYDVYWKQGYSSNSERRAQAIAVAAGSLVEVELTATQAPAATTGAASSVIAAFRLVTGQGENSAPAYPKGAREVQAEYAWKDAKVGTPLSVEWYMGDEKVLEDGEPVASTSGKTTWVLKMSAGGELPDGNYHVIVIEDGQRRNSIPFTIGQTAPAPAPAPTAPSGSGSGGVAMAVEMVVHAWGMAELPAGDLIDSDDFAKPGSGWPAAEHPDSKSAFVDGRYRMSVHGDTSTMTFRGPSQAFDDGLFEVDATPKDGVGVFGIYARWQNEQNFHFFLVSTKAGVAAAHIKDGQSTIDTPLIPWPAGNPKAKGEAYHLRLAALGEHLVFYVDGEPLATAVAAFPKGEAGVFIAPDDTGASEVDFRNWSARRVRR